MTSRSVSRTIQALNDRFVSGTASNNFSHAGVLLHQTDSMDDGETGSGQPWMTSAKHADRFAASIVSKQVPHLYSTSAAGLVLRPSAFQHKDAYWCSYREDGNSDDDDPQLRAVANTVWDRWGRWSHAALSRAIIQ